MAECDGFENRCRCKPTGGSNPSPTATSRTMRELTGLLPTSMAKRSTRSRFPSVQHRDGKWRAAVRINGKLIRGRLRGTQREASTDAEQLKQLRDARQAEGLAATVGAAIAKVGLGSNFSSAAPARWTGTVTSAPPSSSASARTAGRQPSTRAPCRSGATRARRTSARGRCATTCRHSAGCSRRAACRRRPDAAA